MIPSPRLAGRGGYILMEVVVTVLILSLSIVALMPIFAMSYKGSRRSERTLVAIHLAQELMEEIKLRKWDEASYTGRPGPLADPGPLGPDPGEDPKDKRSFNDVDDFAGWREEPPQDPVMRPLAESSGYRRSVLVRYLDSDLKPSEAQTDYKHVSICVASQNVTWTCLDRIFANR